VLFEGSRSGVIEQQEHDMVRNVFRLDDRQIASLMTPRTEIVYLDIEKSLKANLEHLIESDHTRYPVCRGGLHDILGVITAKRLLKQHISGHTEEDITPYLLPSVFVPESLTGLKLLEQFRETGMQVVFVVDEYGDVIGLITLQDLLQAVAGEFKPTDPKDVWAVQREDGSWLLDGMMPVLELKDTLALSTLPDEVRAQYHTLSGMMMWLFGRVPSTGDQATWQDWTLEVVDLDGNRIDKVMAFRDKTTGISNED
jgi:putative hemolysin